MTVDRRNNTEVVRIKKYGTKTSLEVGSWGYDTLSSDPNC